MDIGKLGVWASLDGLPGTEALAFAKRVEAKGYKTLWMPESRGRNVFVSSAWLLAGTSKLILAPGIANIYARDAVATASGQLALNEFSGGRFLLGLGVSHVPIVEKIRGHTYGKPVATMRAYLEAMRSAPYQAPQPKDKPLTILAALGPNMLKLSAELADGAHPYCTNPEHTAEARRIMGPGKLLCPEQMVLLQSDASEARRAGRMALARYLALDNYVSNWRRLGFTDADFVGGGSDRLVDANIAWGDEGAIRKRIQQHWDAGADHVCIQPLRFDGDRQMIDERILELLAPGKR